MRVLSGDDYGDDGDDHGDTHLHFTLLIVSMVSTIMIVTLLIRRAHEAFPQRSPPFSLTVSLSAPREARQPLTFNLSADLPCGPLFVQVRGPRKRTIQPA